MQYNSNDVSVILTCYNEVEFIGDALKSIEEQSAYEAIREVIVVDDGSNDESYRVISCFIEGKNKYRLLTQKNAGLPVARNNALNIAKGKWICFLDGDDLWSSNKVERQLQEANEHPWAILFYTDSIRFGLQNRYIKARDLPANPKRALIDYFLNDAPILSSAMIKGVVFEELGAFDPTLRYAQDTEMWTRIVANYPVRRIPEPLLYRRIHGASLGANYQEKIRYLDLVVEKIVAQFPQLKEFENKKKAKNRLEIAKRYLREGRKPLSRTNALNGMRLDPLFYELYVILVLSYIPSAVRVLELLSKIRMNIRKGAI